MAALDGDVALERSTSLRIPFSRLFVPVFSVAPSVSPSSCGWTVYVHIHAPSHRHHPANKPTVCAILTAAKRWVDNMKPQPEDDVFVGSMSVAHSNISTNNDNNNNKRKHPDIVVASNEPVALCIDDSTEEEGEEEEEVEAGRVEVRPLKRPRSESPTASSSSP